MDKEIKPTKDAQTAERLREQITNLDPAMSTDANAGEIVRFTAKGGADWEIEDACERLELGQIYLVLAVEKGPFKSRVVLHEGCYNTAMFEPISNQTLK